MTVLGGTPATARATRQLGFVFQDPTLLPWRSALDNVRLPFEVWAPQGRRRGRRTPEELLGWSGSAAARRRSRTSCRRDAPAGRDRPGPRHRAAAPPHGRAVRALDEITRDSLNEELLRIWQDTGTTILFVTHADPRGGVPLPAGAGARATNPGRVRELVDCALPYPRPLRIRETTDFVRIAAHLRALLETC